MFGQIVIGPPGSGKTTYCKAMHEFMTGLGRKVTIINLDPANDILPYECRADISDLITVSDVMNALNLGPNGSLVYCMEYLEKNLDWLKTRLDTLTDYYVLFDCPGQVELYTHHTSVHAVFEQLQRWDWRVAAVHLVDSHYCADPAKFISVLMTTLAAMLRVELPHVNVLSKADLLEQHGRLPFNLDFFTEVLDLSYLLERFGNDPFFSKYRKLNEALVGVIEDYSLVSFVALDIKDKNSMLRVMTTADRACGYAFGTAEERSLGSLMSCGIGAEFEHEKIASIQEKYVRTDDPIGVDYDD